MRITLLTDFGTADGYVAAMKGAIAQIAPSVFIDDASHDIPAGDIMAAAFALRRYWKVYPEGTVHVVVVDPGVGSERRALLIAADGRFLVGPDNGVFTFALQDATTARCIEITSGGVMGESISKTFHGRDIFAPAAAHIASGRALETVGRPATEPVRIAVPPPIATASSVLGEIVHIDHFGNLVSNIPGEMLQARYLAKIAEREIRVVETYADAEVNDLVALINSDNVIEIAARNGNAALMLNVERGAPVELHG